MTPATTSLKIFRGAKWDHEIHFYQTGTTSLQMVSVGMNNTKNDFTSFGIIKTGANAPTVKFQFAQGGTVAGTVSLLIGAVAVITKLA